MSLAFEVLRPDRRRATRVAVTERGQTPYSGHESTTMIVDLAVVSRTSERTRNVGRYIKKTERNNIYGNSPECAPDHQAAKYTRLKKLGLPVLSSFRLHTEERSTFSPYITDGYTIYDNARTMNAEIWSTLTNCSEIWAQIEKIFIQAYDGGNGVLLSSDALAIVVDSDNHAQLVIMDIGFGSHLVKDGYKQKDVAGTELFGSPITSEHLQARFDRFIDRVIFGEPPRGGMGLKVE